MTLNNAIKNIIDEREIITHESGDVFTIYSAIVVVNNKVKPTTVSNFYSKIISGLIDELSKYINLDCSDFIKDKQQIQKSIEEWIINHIAGKTILSKFTEINEYPTNNSFGQYSVPYISLFFKNNKNITVSANLKIQNPKTKDYEPSNHREILYCTEL